jgi:hypothetical protein
MPKFDFEKLNAMDNPLMGLASADECDFQKGCYEPLVASTIQKGMDITGAEINEVMAAVEQLDQFLDPNIYQVFCEKWTQATRSFSYRSKLTFASYEKVVQRLEGMKVDLMVQFELVAAAPAMAEMEAKEKQKQSPV